jgi:hypothetical protein
MDENVADGQSIDVRGVDLATLLTETARPSIRTALDRFFNTDAAGLNGFTNSI